MSSLIMGEKNRSCGFYSLIWSNTKIIAISNFYQMIICKDMAWMTGPTGQEEGAGGWGGLCTLHIAHCRGSVKKKIGMALKDYKLLIHLPPMASYFLKRSSRKIKCKLCLFIYWLCQRKPTTSSSNSDHIFTYLLITMLGIVTYLIR